MERRLVEKNSEMSKDYIKKVFRNALLSSPELYTGTPEHVFGMGGTRQGVNPSVL